MERGADNILAERNPLAKEQTPARVLHQQHPNQQDDHGRLRAKDGHILRQAVIPNVRLNEVQQNEGHIDPERSYVHWM